jgi:hypothetical protein
MKTSFQRINSFISSAVIALTGVLLTVQPCRSQSYTVGDMGGWSGSFLTGFGITGGPYGGGDSTCGQTFRINNGNALVSSISFPLYAESSAAEFQVGVAAWNGAQATGSLLYLSDPLVAGGSIWSGKEAALLPLPPLRTGRESFPSSGSSRCEAPCERGRSTRELLARP